MSSSFQSREERFKTFILMRKERWDYYKSIFSFRMKYLLTVFSAFITITALYYKDHYNPVNVSLLYHSWFCILFGIGLIFIHYHMTIKWLDHTMEFEDELYLRENQDDKTYNKLKNLENRINNLAKITDALLFIGLLLFILSEIQL